MDGGRWTTGAVPPLRLDRRDPPAALGINSPQASKVGVTGEVGFVTDMALLRFLVGKYIMNDVVCQQGICLVPTGKDCDARRLAIGVGVPHVAAREVGGDGVMGQRMEDE
jgi:hypothetical protein